jgi:hypothetical protein
MDNITAIFVGVHAVSFVVCAVLGRHKDRMSEGVLFGLALGALGVPVVAMLKSRRIKTHPLEQRLAELTSLRDSGVLTEDEYNAKRQRVIDAA